ncbi:MAG: hypothetical protein JJE41_16165 [Candidatus Heimdallarchaeota archaeon]|nr:hypothetical protein [Candidatus Heimdallarchaeota archaeon]
MVSLCTNFLEEMPIYTHLILKYLHLNGKEVPSAGKAMAKEKKIAKTSRSQQGVLHIKRDLQGNMYNKISEECGIVNYSLCKGGHL